MLDEATWCGVGPIKGKVLPFSLLSVGPGADPSVQEVSLSAGDFLSHPPGGRLPLILTRPAVTFLPEESQVLFFDQYQDILLDDRGT